MVIDCGTRAAFFSFWAVYIILCEFNPNVEYLVKVARIFSVVSTVFDVMVLLVDHWYFMVPNDLITMMTYSHVKIK